MKRITLTIIVIVLTSLLLWTSATLAQASSRPVPAAMYVAGHDVASSENYRLTSLIWKVEGAAGSETYRLVGPARPALQGNGCCCVYLPCVLSNN